MAKFLSNRQRSLDLGINNYTEGSDVLTITGNTNISGIVTAIAGAAVTYYGDGSNLTNLPPASVSISTTAPTSPSAGDLWYSPDYARTLIYYDDGSSQQWIDASPFNVGILTVTNFTASNLNVTSGLNVTGIVTATSFVKSGGTSSQFLKADGSVDSSTYITSADGGNADQLDGQEGTYYLDYNNFTNTPTIPTNNNQLTNGAGFITDSDDITGNAATATQLETARNIGGVSFDGTADINLPGVNATGNQNTSGTAAGLSGAPSITVTDITATGNVSIAGTLTYEDVTSVDSVGLVTARTGVRVTTGGIDISAGGLNVTGVTTSTSFVKSGGTSSQFLKADGSVDTNTYLTSFTETNDLSSAVTWTNVPDANITQSSVTQHQAALSITESQISDLQSYLTDVVDDTTPQLGGDLDLNSNDITGTGNINITGIVTATSYYGDGSNLTGLPIQGVGINTAGGSVGTGVTILDFRGAGISTVTVTAGIATLNITGGGGGGNGSISISTIAPTSPTSGDLWYSPDYGRTFIYYDESSVGYGTSKQWVDAAPFNVGILSTTSLSVDDLEVTNNAIISGITTLGNTVVGGASTELVVNGDARITGILTIGTSSITLDGTNNTINVGSLSLSESGISGATPDINTRNINSSGIITATSFVKSSGTSSQFLKADGSVDSSTYITSSDNITGTSGGLSGSPSITVTDITAVGNVSIGGTLTYEDVTNVDSVGLITARSGVRVTTGGIEVSAGGLSVTGVITASNGVTGNLTGDVTGTASNASGSTGDFSIADKIVHTGDTNTAIRFPAADTFTVETAGSERLRITSGGFIGAGTANPRRHFHLHNSATATVGFQMTNGGTGESDDSQGFQLKVASDGHAEIAQMENSNLRIFTNATERLRITSDGKFGLGTTSPASLLSVEKGNVQNRGQWSDCAIALHNPTNTGAYSQIGFGYTPNQTYASAYLGFISTSQATSGKGDIVIGTRDVVTDTQPSERLRITSDGKMGLGTNNPSVELSIAGSDPQLILWEGADGASSSKVLLGTGTVQGFIALHKGDGTRTVELNSGADSYFTGGKFGIGTASPSDTLHLNGSTGYGLKITDASSHIATYRTHSDGAILKTASNHALLLGTNDTERARITSDGKFGLGTASPGAKLHVNPGAGNAGNIFLDYGAGSYTDGKLNIEVNSNTAIYETVKSGGLAQAWYVTGGEAMRIDTARRLLVGTSSASLSNKFALQGDTSSANNGGYMRLQTGNSILSGTSLGSIGFGDAANNGALIEAKGDVSWSPFTKGSRIEFSTTADGASTPTERMRITSDGKLGLGISSPVGKLAVSDGTVTGEINPYSASSTCFIGTRSNHAVSFQINASEKARIDTSGRLLVGTSSDIAPDGFGSKIQIAALDFTASITTRREGNNPSGSVFNFVKTRSTSLGGNTIVQNEDLLGGINFYGADGTDIDSNAAFIRAYVDGTPGANNMPGRLVFSTTAAGASNPTERLRIGSAGQIGLGGANYGTAGQVITSNGSSSAPTWQDAGGGAWNLLSTTTLSSQVSTVDITSNIDNTYAIYVIEFFDIEPSTSPNTYNKFIAQLYNNGTLITTQDYESIAVSGHTSKSSPDASYNNATYLPLTNKEMYNSAGRINGRLYLYYPGVNSKTEYFMRWETGAGSREMNNGTGRCYAAALSSSTSIDGVRFRFESSGAMDSGTFKLYGIS